MQPRHPECLAGEQLGTHVGAGIGARGHGGPPSSSAAAGPATPAPSQAFKGVNVNLLTFNGPQIAEPLQRRAPDFEALTGAHVNVIAVGFQTIYDKALLDASTKTNSFDAYVFDPQWMGDFVGPGYLLDLTDKVNERRAACSGRTSARSSATSTRPTTARSTPSRSMATSTWSITGATCWPRTTSSRRRPGTTT